LVRGETRIAPHGRARLAAGWGLSVGVAVPVLLAAWVYIVVRAVRVAFTHDEAISYGIIKGVQTFVESANNQWLNTVAMKVARHLFGESEVALRSPNIVAFGFYAVACVVLLIQLRRIAARVAIVTLLVVNPFLLEFFGLARGYGMCVGFLAAGLACALFEDGDRTARRELLRIGGAGVCGVLAFYANFACFNIVVVLLGISGLDLIVKGPRREALAHDRRRGIAFSIVGVCAVALVPGILQVQALREHGQLSYGGHTSFVTDTIDSLLGASSCGYFCKPSWLDTASTSITVIAVIAVIWSVWSGIRSRSISNLQRAAVVFAVPVLGVLIEFAVLGTLYPLDRAALVYLVTFAVLVGFTVDDLVSVASSAIAKGVLLVGSLAVFGLSTGNFVSYANVSQATIWTYDASAHEAIDAAIRFEREVGRPAQPWRLISGFPREESMNYYRVRFRLGWLQPVGREPISTPGGDLYYVGVSELNELPPGTTLLASFPSTDTQLRAAAGLRH
jgi:hypothetical protein